MGIFSLFMFGTYWFWVLTLIAVSVIINSLERDSGNWSATVWLILFVGLLGFFGNGQFFLNILRFILEKPTVVVLYVIGYLAAGVLWSFAKWFFFLAKKRKELGEYEFQNDIQNGYISATRYSQKIIHWMLYWPISGIWTILNDPLRTAFEYLYEYFGKTYDRITASFIKQISKQDDKK
jgi:hypothetical protein